MTGPSPPGEGPDDTSIRVEPIAAHPGFVVPLADTFAREWPQWAATAGRAAVEAIFRPGPAGALPVVLVARVGAELAGTIALRDWFAEDPMPETPWVRQFYVYPRHRGRGVDRALMAAVEREARARGYHALHAATDHIERLLARRGWEVFARREAGMAWLRKDLTSAR